MNIKNNSMEEISRELAAGAYPGATAEALGRASEIISQEIRRCLSEGNVTEDDADFLAAELRSIFGEGGPANKNTNVISPVPGGHGTAKEVEEKEEYYVYPSFLSLL
jgi:hypothetical protein